MANTLTHTSAGFSFTAIADNLVARFKAARARRAAYNRTYNELIQLTDRELNDIGIARSMIDEIASEEAARF